MVFKWGMENLSYKGEGYQKGGWLKKGRDLPYQDVVKGQKMKDETEMTIEREMKGISHWCCWKIPFIPTSSETIFAVYPENKYPKKVWDGTFLKWEGIPVKWGMI